MDVLEESTRFILVIFGPGQQWHHHICADYFEAMRAQFVYEEQFLARGYMLEGFEHAPPMTRPGSVRTGAWTQPRVPTLLQDMELDGAAVVTVH